MQDSGKKHALLHLLLPVPWTEGEHVHLRLHQVRKRYSPGLDELQTRRRGKYRLLQEQVPSYSGVHMPLWNGH